MGHRGRGPGSRARPHPRCRNRSPGVVLVALVVALGLGVRARRGAEARGVRRGRLVGTSPRSSSRWVARVGGRERRVDVAVPEQHPARRSGRPPSALSGRSVRPIGVARRRFNATGRSGSSACRPAFVVGRWRLRGGLRARRGPDRALVLLPYDRTPDHFTSAPRSLNTPGRLDAGSRSTTVALGEEVPISYSELRLPVDPTAGTPTGRLSPRP